MLAIDFTTGIVAVAILFGIFQYVKRTAGPSRWADSTRSHSLQRIREHLMAVAEEPEHPRDWRPHIIAFSEDPERRGQLLKFASWIEGRSGLTTAVQILEGEGVAVGKKQQAAERQLREDIHAAGLSAFSRALVTPDPEIGVQMLIQAFGIGPLKANTVLLNWLGPAGADGEGFRELRFGRNLRAAYRLGCNIVILDTSTERLAALAECPAEGCRIDVWWFQEKTSRLMLLFAYLMTRNSAWEGAPIRVLAQTQGESAETRKEAMKQTLDDVRIEAAIEIVDTMDLATLRDHAADAAVVFLPFWFQANHMTTVFHDGSMEEVLQGLPTAAFVAAAEDIDLEAEPEEGRLAEIAEAQDALSSAQKRLARAEKEVEKAIAAAEKKEQALAASKDAAEGNDSIEARKAEVDQARAAVEQQFRKAAKAQAKLEQAEKTLKDLGALAPGDAGKDEKKENAAIQKDPR
jgi:hypothetical protein